MGSQHGIPVSLSFALTLAVRAQCGGQVPPCPFTCTSPSGLLYRGARHKGIGAGASPPGTPIVRGWGCSIAGGKLGAAGARKVLCNIGNTVQIANVFLLKVFGTVCRIQIFSKQVGATWRRFGPLHFGEARDGRGCVATFDFFPLSGRRYVATFDFPHNVQAAVQSELTLGFSNDACFAIASCQAWLSICRWGIVKFCGCEAPRG